MPDETKYQDKLREMLKDVIGGEMEKANDIMEQTKEEIAKMKDESAELKAKIEAIENAPAQKVQVAVPGKEDKKVNFYKGYNLKIMGRDLDIKNVYTVDPHDREDIAKWMIDVIQGKATNIEGDGARGGYLVPDEYGNVVMAHARLESFALRECMVIPMATDTLRIPKEGTNVSVSWTAEEASLGATNPTFGEIVLSAKRLGAVSTVSNELLNDNQYDFVSLLTSQLAEAIGQEIDDSAMNAAGGSTFTGALSGATTNTVTCAATGTSPNRHIQITNSELSQAIAKLTDNKLRGAKFYVHPQSMHYIRVQEDTAGNPIFAMPGNGVPGTIYEYPYVVSDKVGSATPGASTPFILFGNLKKYYVIGQRRGNMLLEVDPYGLFDTYRTRFRMVTRWDGTPTIESGLVAIKTHA